MALIGVAGFLHETNTFAPEPTPMARFVEADAWPGLLRGAEIAPATRGMNLAISGFIEAAERDGHCLAPLLWCSANPSGPVQREAYEQVAGELEAMLSRQPALDALFLDLHGAMVAQHLQDGEGELLRRLRRVRPGLPIVAALDFHANLSPAMLEHSDALVAYRSYPHVDMAETGRRAGAMLRRLLQGHRPHAALRRAPFIIPMAWQSTLAEPAAGLTAAALALQDEQVWEVQFIPGFPLADIHDSGPSVLVYAASAAAAERAADTLYTQVLRARDAFRGTLYSPAEAVSRALQRQSHMLVAAPAGSRAGEPVCGGPNAVEHMNAGNAATPPSHAGHTVILADTQDNPGGGGSGDTTDLLHELLRRGARKVCAGVVCDPGFAAAAHAAGAGAVLAHPLGAGSGIGAAPLPGPYTVMALGDGRLVGSGPFYQGCRMDLGPMARVRVQGLDIVVSSRKQQAADQAMFRHVGAQPADYDTLVLKSSVHFRADFAALADEILVVAAPGLNTADLHTLHYRNLRPDMEIL
ncbi:M81 family metallopeptidase [Candidimonas nitroreducens]|uniref:Microcystinase C n=1 Tax=Candidimonas nitroreducens TaxID=683354 RepID=A0A225MXG4_9BURK|nr:M81 family metallopeptidase [Candidimonas nitroreducens]OWT65824.1 microcystin degradation protein MlrC [Candidimonas nitroreducens]